MNVRNCRRCGRIYVYDGINKLCPQCRKQDEEEFHRVKEYIYDNPGANVQMVSDATGVSTEKILKFLREGRLELKGDEENLFLDCERCGRPIRTGRFCEKCKQEMEREFKQAIASDKSNSRIQKERDKMYIAEKYKRKK
ncbi:TIGR03826 family flagellar region protein [Caldisalinibacter kiritimatiensis]|uniref:Flagellar protein n=1 Tax=Caldisalinibacter kiritimatiensis TaxID=1304284 RepID=R1AQJ4_9FIRM|nr:TIGR03826 family flagellar region protein [Caldisalinibacter kiritimatiensis]EOC99397.1 flagellar protein [Caldisalinibacter kiritimatiensis]